MDDLRNLPEPSRSRAKALLTCRLCSQYYNDPRVLPCRHSFCRKCLQGLHDKLQATAQPASRRVGSMPCPTCQQPIGIPMTGMRGFPVDTKIARIKDLVVNEMAKNLSKKMTGASDAESVKSDTTKDDDSYSTHSAEYNAREGPKPRREHSYDPSTSSGKVGTGNKYRRNPAFPDFSKFARYFDHEGKPVESKPFKPTIKPDRHRVGYSSSFTHQRKRAGINLRTRAVDDADELFLGQSSRYGSAPHIASEDSPPGNTSQQDDSDSSSDKFSSVYQRSRSARPASTHTRYHHSPAKFDEEDDNTEPVGVPAGDAKKAENVQKKPRTRSKPAAGSDDQTDAFSSVQNERSSSGVRAKPRAKLHSETASNSERPSRTRSGTGTLPVHRENIMTDIPESRYYFKRAKDGEVPSSKSDKIGEEFRSKSSTNVHFGNEGDKAGASGRKLPKTPAFTHEETTATRFERKDADGKQSSSARQERTSSSGSRSTEGSTSSLKPKPRVADENQAPSSTSSYQTSRRIEKPVQHDFTEASNQKSGSSNPEDAESKERSDQHSTRRKLPDDVGSDRQKTNRSETTKTRSKSREKAKVESNGEGASKRNKDILQEPKSAETAAEDSTEFTNAARSRRRNVAEESLRHKKRPEDSSHKAEMEEFELPRFVSTRTKEQRRNDARRNFSNRIRDQFELHKAKVEQEKAERGEVDEEAGKEGADENKSDADNIAESEKGKSIGETSGKKEDEKGAEKKKKEEDEKPGRNWEELLNNARFKYSMEREEKVAPAPEEPKCADGVGPRWRLTKKEFAIPTSMAITSKGCVVVAEFGLGCVEFYDDSGVLSHNMEGLKPFSVVINEKEQIIVGDRKGHGIKIFDEYGGDVAHWEGTLFNWICGIACLPNNQLAIYDREKCKLGIYSPPGDLVREFASFGTGESQLCMADFIATDSKNRLLVADSGNHCVKVYDASSGKFLSKFGDRGKEDGLLEWPKGICVDKDDNVIVTDLYNARVSMYSPDGKFLQHLLTGIPNPYSICYCKQTSCIGITQYSMNGSSQYDVYAI